MGWLEAGAGLSLAAAAAWMLSLARVAILARWLASAAPHDGAWALAAAAVAFGLWFLSETCSVRVDP